MSNPINSSPESYVVSSSATATYSNLGVSTSVNVLNADLVAGGLRSEAIAGVVDNLVMSLPANDLVSLVLNMQGTSTATNLGYSAMLLDLFIGPQNGTPVVGYSFSSKNFSGQVVFPVIPVYRFETYPYSILMFGDVLTNASDLTAVTSTSYTAAGSVAFSASLAGVGVWDPNGKLLTDAIVGSAGNNSNFPVLNVPEVFPGPEPHTYLATGVGMLCLALVYGIGHRAR